MPIIDYQCHLSPEDIASDTSGVLRNNNRMMRELGADTGYDSIGDFDVARPLSRFMGRLDSTNQLAKPILYNLNSVQSGLPP